MKIFKKIIPLVLVFVLLVAGITVAGCSPSIEDVTKTIQTIDEAIEKYSADEYKIFKQVGQPYQTNYYTIDIGISNEEINSLSGNNAQFQEIMTEFTDYYNPIFSYSMSYIAENKGIVSNYLERELPKASEDRLEKLNDNMESFRSSLETFASARKTFVSDFHKTNTETTKLTYTRKLEYAYSTFVSESVNAAVALAEFVESTGVLEAVSQNAIESQNLKLFKNYICINLLPVYKDLYLVEFCGFNWSDSASEGTDKQKIESIRTKLGEIFNGVYKEIFTADAQKIQDEQKLRNLLEDINERVAAYTKEMQVVERALAYISIQDLASTKYKNDLAKYTKDHEFAQVCVEKLSNFVNVVTPNFLNYIKENLVSSGN